MLSRRLFLSSGAAVVTTGASVVAAGAQPLIGRDALRRLQPNAALGPDLPLDPAARASRVAWLQQHTMEIDSTDFDDNEFDDLEAFGKAVGAARVVMLGEQTHGDGTAFRAKARLIRFLHEELGFDVLAFESGFYDMHKVWERIRAGDDAAKAARSGMFGMWSRSRQVRPLIDYIGDRADSSRPLELAGFDCQFSGRASKDHLVDDLVEFLAKHGFDVATIADWPRSRGAIQKVVESRTGPDRKLSAEERDLVFAAIETLSGRIAGIDNADGAFWGQLLKSMKVQTQLHFQVEPQNWTVADFSLRDNAMADNLIWLAREAYPQSKIIVWAANTHILRNMQILDWDPALVTMGHSVSKALGDTVYSVGFTAHDGERGWVDRDPTPVAPAYAGSLEDLWAATEHDRAFLDLRAIPAGGEWLRAPSVGYPAGNQLTKAEWTQMFDAVVFLRTMRPARAVD